MSELFRMSFTVEVMEVFETFMDTGPFYKDHVGNS